MMETPECLIDADELVELLKKEIEIFSKQGKRTIKERTALLLVISYIKDMKNYKEEKTNV